MLIYEFTLCFVSNVNAAETRWSSFPASFEVCFHCRFSTPCSSKAKNGFPISGCFRPFGLLTRWEEQGWQTHETAFVCTGWTQRLQWLSQRGDSSSRRLYKPFARKPWLTVYRAHAGNTYGAAVVSVWYTQRAFGICPCVVVTRDHRAHAASLGDDHCCSRTSWLFAVHRPWQALLQVLRAGTLVDGSPRASKSYSNPRSYSLSFSQNRELLYSLWHAKAHVRSKHTEKSTGCTKVGRLESRFSKCCSPTTRPWSHLHFCCAC